MDDGELVHEWEALDALRAWLLTEEAYARDGVADEVLNYLQDHIGRLLGPRAITAAGDFLRERAAGGGDLTGLARDRSMLADLLAHIEGKRRRGFEMEWRAFPLEPPDDGTFRPEALLVMAEHSVGDPVWDRPRGTGSPVSLSELGVSAPLRQRLREWNEEYERSALDDDEDPGWIRHGLTLAHDLQRELPGIDVRYFHADDDRPLRSL